jgi:hypothetical protein
VHYKNVVFSPPFQDGDYVMEKEYEGRGLCPYDPDHNSTAVYSGKYSSFVVGDVFILISFRRINPVLVVT